MRLNSLDICTVTFPQDNYCGTEQIHWQMAVTSDGVYYRLSDIDRSDPEREHLKVLVGKKHLVDITIIDNDTGEEHVETFVDSDYVIRRKKACRMFRLMCEVSHRN